MAACQLSVCLSGVLQSTHLGIVPQEQSAQGTTLINLAHQNRTIAIASDFRIDGAKSPEIPQKDGVWGSEIAARNRRSLASFHRTLKSQCIIAVSCLGNRAISGVRDGHRNRKSQKSLRFRCAKLINHGNAHSKPTQTKRTSCSKHPFVASEVSRQ